MFVALRRVVGPHWLPCGAPRRDMRPTAHSLSFACPKESKQRKGHPESGGPGVPGLLCAARSSREVQKLALRAQTSELLDPSYPALLDASHGDPKSQHQQAARLAVPNIASIRNLPTMAMRSEPKGIGSWAPLRRAEQRSGRRKKKRRCLSPQGEFCASRLPRAAQGSPGTPGPRNRGRLSFGDFSLAKQRKGTALSGAYPDAVRRTTIHLTTKQKSGAGLPPSVPEVPHPGQHHRNATLIGSRDHLVVTH